MNDTDKSELTLDDQLEHCLVTLTHIAGYHSVNPDYESEYNKRLRGQLDKAKVTLASIITQQCSQARKETADRLHKLADKNGGISRKDIHDLANELQAK